MSTEIESVSPAAPQRDNALYRAWRARIDRYLDQAFQAMSNEDRVAALSAPDDFWTFFETLVLSPAQTSDPERRTLMREEINRRRMLESRGGCLTASQLAQVLGISRQAVNQRRLAGTLLGVLDGGRYVYPRCQLDRNGMSILPGLAQTLEIFRNTGTDPWTILLFLASGQDALDGAAPIDLLSAGALNPVLRAIRLHVKTVEKVEELVDGQGENVKIGKINRNRQLCCGHRQVRGTDHNQYSYMMVCLRRACTYGSNGSDVFERKCPYCQRGAEGIDY